ncbi:unnamed protein product [Protopolystoma xenopodis]|uniref:Uncharacterized protein n=1 Tax=Protopolystoma xenopodis TaxID=117903 RepID=A0A448XEA8_9PLAT|nr:unnamed protein product [Protopolystoma xenopodis]
MPVYYVRTWETFQFGFLTKPNFFILLQLAHSVLNFRIRLHIGFFLRLVWATGDSEEEKRLKELHERLVREQEKELEEKRRKEEEERARRYEQELRELEERQRSEAEEQRRIRREQELILNRKHVRPKVCFAIKK